MASNNINFSTTVQAAVDFTSLENRFVKIDSNGYGTVCTATADIVAGVSNNAPITGAALELVSVGNIGKVELAATLSAGAIVCTDTDGKAIAAVATSRPAGILKSGGDSGDLAEILLTGGTVTVA